MAKKETDSQEAEEQILINIMYTGDYTNKNIGHEIINLYKTDKDENYIYVSPYGRIHKNRYSHVKTVLFARPAGTNMLEIIAKAEGLKPLDTEAKLYGEDKNTKKAQKQEQEEILKKDFYLVQAGKYCEIEELKEKTLEDCKNIFEEANANNKQSEDDLKKNIKNWIKWRPLNIAHRQLIKGKGKDNEIKYGGVFLNEIFSNNERNDCSAHFTFKASKVTRVKRPIYFSYIMDKKKEDTPKNTSPTEKAVTSADAGSTNVYEHKNVQYLGKSEDKDSITYKFRNIKFRNMKCMKYIEEDDYNEELKEQKLENLENQLGEKYIYAVLKKIIEEKDNWSDKEKIKTIKESLSEDFEPCFLDIVGKQHEELAYSNMFAHFFKEYPAIFEIFVQKVLGIEEFKKGKTFEIAREENDIDIIIYTENDIFVIENKIKSHINGEKSKKKQNDESQTAIYTNQLIKYYDYAEKEGDKKGKVTHYYIFKPDYNRIDDELEKIKNKNKNTEIEKILDKYEILNYSKIKCFFENVSSVKETVEKDLYFKEFVKALKRHSNPTDNIIELEMGYKFRQAINRMKP